MNEITGTRNMALFCDYENVELGVRDARCAAFDLQRVSVYSRGRSPLTTQSSVSSESR